LCLSSYKLLIAEAQESIEKLCEKSYLVSLKSLDVAITEKNKSATIKAEDVLSMLYVFKWIVQQITSHIIKTVNVL